MFPGFDRVFRVYDGTSNRAFRGSIRTDVDIFRLARGEIDCDRVDIAWAQGSSEPGDVIRALDAVTIILSRRVIDMLQRLEFTGWKTYDVRITGRDGRPHSGYKGLAITGRCGPLDNSRNVKVDRIYPAGAFPATFGFFFDSKTWDGSDFFMPAGRNAYTCVVERVRDALLDHGVKGFKFVKLTEEEREDV